MFCPGMSRWSTTVKPALVEVVADVRDLAGRNGRSDRPDVKDIVETDIVDVPGQAGDFLVTFLAEDVPADRTTRHHTAHSTTPRLARDCNARGALRRSSFERSNVRRASRTTNGTALECREHDPRRTERQHSRRLRCRARSIFEDSPWVAERAWRRRPFASLEALHQAMMTEVSAARSATSSSALLRAHPDLGSRARMTDASTGEQAGAGLDRLTPTSSSGCEQLNTAYREKFGFPFLFAVKGSTKHDVLAALAARLPATPDEEFAEALRQVSRIAWFRLQEWWP